MYNSKLAGGTDNIYKGNLILNNFRFYEKKTIYSKLISLLILWRA